MINQDTHKGPSFTLKNRIARAVWNLVYTLFFRFSPRPLHGWRRFLLRLFGADVGSGVHVYPKVRIWAPWNLVLEEGCGIADRVILYSQGRITVGRKAIISQASHICAGTHDYATPGFPLITAPITVGAHAWVAAEVFVHPGMNIGEGAVIGARSVVISDMPAWMLCSGFPCKPIRERAGEAEIQRIKNA